MKKGNLSAGFTLIELLVTIGIISIVSAISIAGYPQFRQRANLKMTAQQIAMTIRQAQAYGLGTRMSDSGGIVTGYGVHFNITSPNYYFLFADEDGDEEYDDGEEFKSFSISTGDKILSMIGTNSGSCSAGCNISKADVVYTRPNPIVNLTDDGTNIFSKIEVTIGPLSGRTSTITIWLSGQISID